MNLEHVYITVDGVGYYDYKMITLESHSIYRERNYLKPGYLILDDATQNNLLSLLPKKNENKLPKGNNIHIIPSSSNKYAVDDLRKYYNLKKNLDGGDYNIYCEFDPYRYYTSKVYLSFAIAPSEKLIIASDQTNVNNVLLAWAKNTNPSLKESDLLFFPNRRIVFSWHKLNSQYDDILKGNVKKPLLHISCLDINSTEELTANALKILIHSGKRYYGEKDAVENFVLNLNMINQHNWREYLGTMHFIFQEVMRYGSTKAYVGNHLSGYSKVVKDIFRSSRAYSKFQSEKDFNMCKSFLEEILQVGDSRFTDFRTLQRKLADNDISFDAFFSIYDNIIKIQPKKYEGEKKN